MNGLLPIRRFTHLGAAAIIAVLGLGATVVAPAPAAARVFVGVGVGVPLYYPGPYYGYPYGYPPAYYPPPPAYYPPPAPAYYPPPQAAAPGPMPAIAYTNRPAFYNSAGQQCREYKSTQMVGGRATDVYGTACMDSTGQWRVTN